MPGLKASKQPGAVLVYALLLLLPSLAFAQLPSPTYGWNLGNTLEPPSGEGTWGPAATQQLINSVAASGFNTIRIPVAWNSHANQTTYQIDAAWMARVKQVVDWCYAANLNVVINCHWDGGWLDNRLDGNVDADVNAKMNAYWTQIANTFVNYDSKLLFAGANEPPADTAAEMSELLTYYQTFVNAVRATGGQNTNRWLVLSGPNTSIDLTDSLMNTLPSDPTPGRLMVEVHYYPYQWTLMTEDATWGKMFYFWGQGYHSATMTDRNSTWGEEAYADEQFQKIATKFISKGVPVILGEWGAVKRTGYANLTGTELNRHLASRTYFSKTITDKANALGLKPIWWDAGGTGSNTMWLFDRSTAAVIDPDNLRALTGGPALPPPGGGIIVNVAPAITTQPASQAVVAGSAAMFSAAASGTPAPTYQWKKDSFDLVGATGATYTIASVQAADAGSYTVVATNSLGSATSAAAVLTVQVAPVMATHPAGQTVTTGNPVSFTVAATGTPAPTYQWKKDGVDIAGATGTTYAIASAQPADAGSYTVVATNAAGTTTSHAAVFTVRAGRADFNSDGKPDLIWSNSMTGERALWLMNGTQFLAASTLGIFPLEWTIAATGDFNSDGKPDIVWSNSLTGERALWLMNGTNLLGVSTLGIFPLEWTVTATGDFNFDGKPDLVWSNSLTGERALWLMNGTQFLAASTLGIFPLEWTVAATGDFNTDGKPDLVWSNSLTGERALWLMDGTQFLAASTLGIFPLEWTVRGTADFNADTKTDLIWSNSLTGERALWLLDGTQFLAASTLGLFPLEWTVGN